MTEHIAVQDAPAGSRGHVALIAVGVRFGSVLAIMRMFIDPPGRNSVSVSLHIGKYVSGGASEVGYVPEAPTHTDGWHSVPNSFMS